MSEIFEILKYTLPSVVVVICVVFIIKSFFKAEFNKGQLAAKGQVSDKTVLLRLQAYERVVLFLERISPQHLVLRVDPSDLDAITYQKFLLQTIRDEFEHNIAQQIYISFGAWSQVKAARDSVVRMVNQAREDSASEASAIGLATRLIQLESEDGNLQITHAIDFVKKEVAALF